MLIYIELNISAAVKFNQKVKHAFDLMHSLINTVQKEFSDLTTSLTRVALSLRSHVLVYAGHNNYIN